MRRLVVIEARYVEDLQAAVVTLGFSPDEGLSGVQFTVTVGAKVLKDIDKPDEMHLLFAHLMKQGALAYDTGVFIEHDPEWITHVG